MTQEELEIRVTLVDNLSFELVCERSCVPWFNIHLQKRYKGREESRGGTGSLDKLHQTPRTLQLWGNGSKFMTNIRSCDIFDVF